MQRPVNEGWFAWAKSQFRPREQVIADAMVIAETDFAIAPEFTDAVERGIVGIHENGFDEELMSWTFLSPSAG